MLEAVSVIEWIEKLIAFAIILQSIELWQLRKQLRPSGVFSWEILKKDFLIFPPWAQKIFDLVLSYPSFMILIVIQIMAAISLLFLSTGLAVYMLFLSVTLITLRWRGTFNGGSDFMTLVVLMSLAVAESFKTQSIIATGALWYMSIQVCASYFIGGIIKLKKSNWRQGLAIQNFIQTSIYTENQLTQIIMRHKKLAQFVSWLAMIFECSFPLALLNTNLCMIYISIGFLFHLANFYFFGLNRFVWSWLAAYPALYYCSSLNL